MMMTEMPASPATPLRPQQPGPLWREATVALTLPDGRYLLDDGAAARQALSCLLQPERGDRVLFWTDEAGERYILHLLSRPEGRSARLQANGISQLQLQADELSLLAERQLKLQSLHDAELSAGQRLSIQSRHLNLTVLESLLQNARQVVSRCEHWLQEARGLVRLHGKQTMVSADEDVRVDAERISMG